MKRDWVPLFAAVSTSEKLASLGSDRHRLFYTWLLPQCDAWGRIEASPRVLNAKVWPMLRLDPNEAAKALTACMEAGLLQVFEANGQRWIQVPDWEEKAGKIGQLTRDRGASKFPPQGEPRVTLGLPQGKPAQSRAEESRGEQNPPLPPSGGGTQPWAAVVASLPDRAAWEESCVLWATARRENGHKKLGPTGWGRLLKAWGTRGPAAFRAAVEHSAAQGWQSVNPPDRNGHPVAAPDSARAQIESLFQPRKVVDVQGGVV